MQKISELQFRRSSVANATQFQQRDIIFQKGFFAMP